MSVNFYYIVIRSESLDSASVWKAATEMYSGNVSMTIIPRTSILLALHTANELVKYFAAKPFLEAKL